jgi:hypothetical protein
MIEKAVALFRLPQAEGGAYVIASDEGGTLGTVYLAQRITPKHGFGKDPKWSPIPMPEDLKARMIAFGFSAEQFEPVSE